MSINVKMATTALSAVAIFFIAYLQTTKSSILPKMRSSPHEFVAPPDTLLDIGDLPQDMYNDLLKEVPVLQKFLDPKRRRSRAVSEEIITEADDDDDNSNEIPRVNNTYDVLLLNDSSNPVNLSSMLPFIKGQRVISNITRKRTELGLGGALLNRLWWNPWWDRTPAIKCFWCGLESPERIPRNPICYNAFESDDWRAKTLARYFRVECIHGPRLIIGHGFWTRAKPKLIERFLYDDDRGLIRQKLWVWRTGDEAFCFKRYLDVGTVYTQRGCGGYWPKVGQSFTSHRFIRMEMMMRKYLKREGLKEGCMVAPAASLTPFSRAISLFAHYHVCFCNTNYCNSARRQNTTSIYIFSIVFGILTFVIHV